MDWLLPLLVVALCPVSMVLMGWMMSRSGADHADRSEREDSVPGAGS